MEKNELLNIILKNPKKLVTYYPYRTGGGSDYVVSSTDNPSDYYLKNFIDLMIQLGASAAGCRNDNKTAVELQVEGLNFPIYFYKFDGVYTITLAINSENKGKKINWLIE